jgi:hypothetical protein
MNILFFITHKTLDHDHADMSIKSISLQETDKIFDVMYIYNSHEDDIKNEDILKICYKYNILNKVRDIKLFQYNVDSNKTLASDISEIRNFCLNNHKNDDRVLILKSDIMLSKNYFNDVLNISKGEVIFTSPFVCGKKRVSNDELLKYISRDSFIESDEITFFTEDEDGSNNNDFINRVDNIEDDNIKFFSCRVVNDFSCHFISISLLNKIILNELSWAGANFSKLREFHRSSKKSFTLHKYHEIISTNRSGDREGPVQKWLNS